MIYTAVVTMATCLCTWCWLYRWRGRLPGPCVNRLVHHTDDHHSYLAAHPTHCLHRLPQPWRRLSRSVAESIISLTSQQV